MVAAEERSEAELLGALRDGEEVVVGGALLGLGEDAELGEVEHVIGGYEHRYGRAHVGFHAPVPAPVASGTA